MSNRPILEGRDDIRKGLEADYARLDLAKIESRLAGIFDVPQASAIDISQASSSPIQTVTAWISKTSTITLAGVVALSGICIGVAGGWWLHAHQNSTQDKRTAVDRVVVLQEKDKGDPSIVMHIEDDLQEDTVDGDLKNNTDVTSTAKEQRTKQKDTKHKRRESRKRRFGDKKEKAERVESDIPISSSAQLSEPNQEDGISLFDRGALLFSKKQYAQAELLFLEYRSTYERGPLYKEALVYLFDIALHRQFSKDIISYGLLLLKAEQSGRRQQHIVLEVLKAASRVEQCLEIMQRLNKVGVSFAKKGHACEHVSQDAI